MKISICTIIVTFNPELLRFTEVVTSALDISDRVVIIDNKSENIDELSNICNGFANYRKLEIIKFEQNSGIACALNEGVRRCLNFEKPDFIITLDQDSIVNIRRDELEGYIERALSSTGDMFGALALSGSNLHRLEGEFGLLDYSINSGMVIKSCLFENGLKYREEFFMDQVDFDLSYQIRKMGKQILVTKKKTLDHRVGTRVSWLGKEFGIESDWRLYLLYRNSTVLLKEKKITLQFYLHQALYHIIIRLLGSGVRKNLRLPSVVLTGISDGLSRDLSNNFKFFDRYH
ncbi:MAG: glycosyltransferase [Conexivisphaerales archaeon]